MLNLKMGTVAILLLLSFTSCNDNKDTPKQPNNQSNSLKMAGSIIKKYNTKKMWDTSKKTSENIPIYQYYQKIPAMKGVTNDPENLIFNLQIELGYTVGDLKTLEKLSKLNAKIAGDIRQSIAAKTKIYLGNLNNHAEIEKDIMAVVNKIIAPNPQDSTRVQDVIIVELFLHEYR